MSLIDLASMVLAPTAVKDGKVYNAIPNDQDFTFSRGTEATRVNSAGLIEKARTNFLLQSNTFDTTWTNTRTSEVSGYTGYNGTNDAWALIGTAVDSTHLIVQTITLSEQVVTFSVYAKAGAQDWCILRLDDGTPAYCYFDLSTGTKGAISGSYIDSNITSVGGGWYRLSITRVATNGTNVAVIYPASADNDNTYLGDGVTEDLYIQDAQLEQGLVATDVITTTTSSVTVGITDDLPRVDYSGGGCPSLLLEPSRTNIIVQSEYFNAWWGRTAASITDNATTSPEGVTNAGKIVESATTASHLISRSSIAVSSGSAYVLSAFVKAGGRNTFRLFYDDGVGSGYAFFNVSTGAKGTESGVTADIEDYGNGWYRCYITFTAASTSTYIQVLLAQDDETTNYAGNGTDGIFLFGAQLEEASYASSYIPTYGTSTSRSADSCSLTNASNLIGQSEGTIFVEVDSRHHISELSDGTNTNRILFYTDGSTLELRYLVKSSGTTYFNVSTGVTISSGDKIALAYANNDCVIYKNGSLLDSKTSVTIPANSKINIGSDYNGSTYQNNSINQAILFPTRLTNDQLAELTK